ncbi:LuxR C-terminal-related transcriptional regulator [Actinokineospora soli]|uniref:LuxR C-terminal-related transcriptional regulator n=1 Tax=Actinokineospora soli TaxID=1048753 RepID=A0ABW2TVA6_9PSEU
MGQAIAGAVLTDPAQARRAVDTGLLGLTEEDEAAYRMLLRGRSWTAAGLAARLGWPVERADEALTRLAADGLTAESAERPGAVRAVEPCVALPTLAGKRARPEDAGDAAAIARFVASTRRPLGGPGQHVAFAGLDDAAAYLERLATAVSSELVFLVPTWNPGGHEFARHIAETALRRGATVRHIWSAAVADHPQAAEYAAWLSARWAPPRVVDQVPVRATLVDGATAVLADTQRTGLVRATATLNTLTHMADRLWASARPVPARPCRGRAGSPDSRNQVVLRLLADGLTDDAIARRVGVSVRTIRNDVADAMTRLQARSRFQAGVRAVQLGLI